MGLDSLNKSNEGAALISNFKDIFPNDLSKLYIYKGINLVSKGNEVFSREDTTSFIELELLAEADVVYGGQVLTSTVKTITESKSIKETARQKVSTDSVTCFLRDLGGVDLTEHNLYYTIAKPFVMGDLKEDQLDVLSDAQIVPSLLKKLITGVKNINANQQNLILNNKSISFTLTPAILDNNLPSSTIRFVDADIYKPIPVDEDNFEILSVDIESDQNIALEYGNGIKGRGIIENGLGQNVETDIDFKMDKPLLPLQITPYAKSGNVAFAINNFNYNQRMPYLSAKHFLSSDRSITTFIKGTLTDTWVTELAETVVNMFVMSWAISTGFNAYRDTSGEIKPLSIGGVAIKHLEGKDPSVMYSYVDQILLNWEYKNNVKNKKTAAYKRALQVLAASSEFLQSKYCVGKGLTEFHKSIFDFWLDLNTVISESTTDIDMTLASARYEFTYEQTSAGDNDFSKPIINLAKNYSISKVVVDNNNRLTSLSELDDPISINLLSSFAGDIDPTNSSATKYFVGVDITDPKQIASFLADAETEEFDPHTETAEVDTPWYVMDSFDEASNIPRFTSVENYTLVKNQKFQQLGILESGQTDNMIGKQTVNAPKFTDAERDTLIKSTINIPKNAYNVKVATDSLQLVEETQQVYYQGQFGEKKEHYTTKMIRYTGAVVSYTINTTSHGVNDKKQTYDKSEFLNMIIKYSDSQVFKRNLVLDETWRNNAGVSSVKIKELSYLFFSQFLGNYVDIKINYKYNDAAGIEVKETSVLPRIYLPSEHDETRTKIGIRL